MSSNSVCTNDEYLFVFSFLLLCNKLPQILQLHTIAIYYLGFHSSGEGLGLLGQAEIKVLANDATSAGAQGPLPSSIRLSAEFSVVLLWDLGPFFLTVGWSPSALRGHLQVVSHVAALAQPGSLLPQSQRETVHPCSLLIII